MNVVNELNERTTINPFKRKLWKAESFRICRRA